MHISHSLCIVLSFGLVFFVSGYSFYVIVSLHSTPTTVSNRVGLIVKLSVYVCHLAVVFIALHVYYISRSGVYCSIPEDMYAFMATLLAALEGYFGEHLKSTVCWLVGRSYTSPR